MEHIISAFLSIATKGSYQDNIRDRLVGLKSQIIDYNWSMA